MSGKDARTHPVDMGDDAQTPIEEVPCHMHMLRLFLGLILFPITIFTMWKTVQPREALLVICFGKLWKVIDEPGCHVIVPWGCSFHTISTKYITIDTEKSTISDLNGNPVIVGAIVNYHIVDPVKAFFNVEFVHNYVKVNAGTVLKAVVSKYPYESKDPSHPSLKNASDEIKLQLAEELRKRVRVAGVEVSLFDLSDLYYAPEIASAMLIRQQAQATIDARHLIVDGAVDIVGGALEGLSAKGVRVSESEAAKIASNLLCVLCSDGHTQNVLPLHA
eukprot:TRINITY_DN88_c0_g2_i3.p2 TRINITY_DN88_c0_g2~~TRINITY_DN88_c0_g2_i3.p2  ORF type:complete len:276 (+),score=127.50 TRINITY_DN88_c0_g2_i3:41-868(+)